MNARLIPWAIAATAAVAFASLRNANASLILEFDVNAVSVQAMAPDVNNVLQPALMNSANFTGTLVISKNANSVMNSVVFANITHPSVTLVNIAGSYGLNNGFSTGGSVSLTFQNPDASQSTYSFNIPSDFTLDPNDKSAQQSLNPIRYDIGWDTNTDLLSTINPPGTPRVSDMTFPNPLGLGFFNIHDFMPDTTGSNPSLGLDNAVDIEIGVVVPVTVPEPATLTLAAVAVPALLLKRRRKVSSTGVPPVSM